MVYTTPLARALAKSGIYHLRYIPWYIQNRKIIIMMAPRYISWYIIVP
jgi:hypothetical protein